jgi:effector-binding domain-containing protein
LLLLEGAVWILFKASVKFERHRDREVLMKESKWLIAGMIAVLFLTFGGTVQAQEMEKPEATTVMGVEGHALGCTCDGCVTHAMEKAGFATVDVMQQPYVGIRYTMLKGSAPDSFGMKMGEVMGKLMGLVQAGKVEMTGPPFSLYFGEVEGGWDMLTGIPVKSEAMVEGEFSSGTIPGGKALKATHYGPYAGLATTYAAWEKYKEDNKITSTGAMWEVYVNDPKKVTDPSQLRTELYQILN